MWGGGVRLAFVHPQSGDFLAYTENTLSQREHTPPPLLRLLVKIHQTDTLHTQQAMQTGAAAVSCALYVSHDRWYTVGLSTVKGTATRTAAQEGQWVVLCGEVTMHDYVTLSADCYGLAFRVRPHTAAGAVGAVRPVRIINIAYF